MGWLRAFVSVGALLWLSACDAPLLVDCAPGVFTRADDDGWCVYERASGVRCPSGVPVEHALPRGALGCASREHDPVPPQLCAAVGTCGDGG